MGQERDERWAYVVLILLVVGYVVYRFVLPEMTSGVSLEFPEIDLGRLGRTLPYLFAPLFAVLSEIIRRRKVRAVRETWERQTRVEGFLRGEEKVRIRFVHGGRGSIQGDVRLTRAALYVHDAGGRRDPMRFAFAPSEPSVPSVVGVSVRAGAAPEIGIVRIDIGGDTRFSMEFGSRQSSAWHADIRRLLPSVTRGEPGGSAESAAGASSVNEQTD